MTIKMVSLKIKNEICAYNQNPQTADIQYSLLKRIDKNSFEELHYKVKCREYFGDSLLAANFDKNLPNIYGFSLIDKRQTLEETLFSVWLPYEDDKDKEIYHFFIKKVSIIRKLERSMGIPLKNRTKYYETEYLNDGIKRLVIVSPKEWQYSTLLISLYTFILRLMTYIVGEKENNLVKYMDFVKKVYGGVDSDYIKSITGLDVMFLLKNYIEIFGEDRLTGIDDIKINEIFSETNSDKQNIIDFTVNNENLQTIFSIGANHRNHGLVSFYERVKSFINDDINTDYYKKCLGSKWSYNYCKLKGVMV